jgi:hypothetical protein
MKLIRHDRRSLLRTGIALGVASKVSLLGPVDAAAIASLQVGTLLARVTFDGKVYNFAEENGKDLGD